MVQEIYRPLLGGVLSTPAKKYSWLDTAFFRKYPYFLPGGVAGVVVFTAVIIGFFVLREVSCDTQILAYAYLTLFGSRYPEKCVPSIASDPRHPSRKPIRSPMRTLMISLWG